MGSLPKVIFVYNANSGFMHSMNDLFRKTASPNTYACKLCSLTYSGAFMNKVWKEYISRLSIEAVFMHKDEFTKAYPSAQTAFPVILLETGQAMTTLIGSKDFKNMKDLPNLMSLLAKRLQAQKAADKKLYQCPECGLHYKDKKTADKCAAWCSKYKSCNLEITK